MARQAGAEAIEVRLDHADNHVRHDIDGELFLESRVTATATGRPALGARRTEFIREDPGRPGGAGYPDPGP